MFQPRKVLPLVSLSAVIALVLAACGGGGEEATPIKATPTRAAPAATPVPTAAPAPTPTAGPAVKRGGTLTYPAIAQLATTDFSKLYNFTPHYAFGHVYSTLLKFKDRIWSDTEIEGDLASSWEVSQDGKTYTFRINPNARWQNVAPVNGRAVTAGDVKWTWELITSADYGSAYRSRWPAPIEGMDAPDAGTLVVRLKQSFAPLTAGLANSILKIFPQEVYQADKEFGKRPIGSGAFVFVESQPTVGTKTRASPNYWKQGVDGRPLPYLDAVESILILDSAAIVAGLKAGQLAFTSPSGVTFDQAQDLIKNTPSLVVTKDFNLFFNLVRINNAVKPFDNEKVRRAIMRAIDQQGMLNNIWRQPDGPLNGFISAGVKNFELSQDELKQTLKFDLAEAKRLLQEGGAAGVSVKLTTQVAPRDPVAEAALAFIVQSLNDAGLKSEPFIPPGGAAAGNQALQRKDYTLLWGTQPFEGNAWNYIRTQWHSQGSSNFLNVNDPALDKLIDDAEAELDVAKQQQRIKDIQRYVFSKAYSVPVVNGWIWITQQKSLKNYSRTWPWGHNGLEHAWLDR